MPVIPEATLRRIVSVSCPEWGSHFRGCDSPSIHTAEDGLYPLAQVPHRSQDRMKGARLPSLPLLRAFLQGGQTNKGQDRDLEPGDSLL